MGGQDSTFPRSIDIGTSSPKNLMCKVNSPGEDTMADGLDLCRCRSDNGANHN
jgi:hypothetical protein